MLDSQPIIVIVNHIKSHTGIEAKPAVAHFLWDFNFTAILIQSTQY
jgi:hypothetical protein